MVDSVNKPLEDYTRYLELGFTPFDPLELAKQTEKIVCDGNRRKYTKISCPRMYGGIATGYACGCCLRCIFCWVHQSRDFPEKYGSFKSPDEVFNELSHIARRKKIDQLRISGAEPDDNGRVVIFCGSSSNNGISYEVTNGGRLLVRDVWYETSTEPRFIHLTGSGEFTLHGAAVTVASDANNPAIVLDDFSGKVSLISTYLSTAYPYEVPAKIILKGLGENMNLLALGLQGNMPNEPFIVNQSPYARYALLNSRRVIEGGTEAVPDEGIEDPDFLREMLAQTRSEQPCLVTSLADSSTDARFYRIFATQTTVGIHLKAKVLESYIDQDN